MVGQPEAWTAVAAVIALVLTLGSTGVRVAVLLARLTDSVRALNVSMEKVMSHVGNHETRISRLEDHEDTRITRLEKD